MVEKYLHCEMAWRSKYKLQQPVYSLDYDC